ncbi:MAG: LacI family DNA-binding transcriptional regulator [Lawsonibacter sp.]|nr:LacI family DNA-binding transcriptional regulator [Lawsonibacter sp.]
MEKRVTAKDVAKLAGVSPSAVSMILNNYKDMKFPEETRRRVFDACNTLGYRRMHTGFSNNVMTETHLLMAICPSYDNMHYVKLISAMQERARELGYSLMAFNTSRVVNEETKILQICGELPFKGVLFLYQPENAIALQRLSWKKPIVHVYDKNNNISVDTLELNSYKLGCIVGEHLIALGHKNIAYITTSLEKKQVARIKRVEGLKDTMREHGLNPNEGLTVLTPETLGIEQKKKLTEYEVGYLIAGEIVEQNLPITAIAGMNDMIAFGIIDAVLERKKKVPQDYSVCGCDNVAVSKYNSISLTTIEHFADRKGREAVEMLVKKIEGEHIAQVENEGPVSVMRVEFSPKLIVRSSTKRCTK